MPIPLLFIAIAAGTGALGIGKSVKAGVDTHKAKKINSSANDLIDSGKQHLEMARSDSATALQALGRAKAEILSSSVTDFVNTFEMIKNIDFQKSSGLNELSKFKMDRQSFKELKDLGGFATSILGGVAGGTLGGALTAFGAYSAAGAFAAASTGTAIATLSGAAATNATLAFFGGGSLAAGGLGMAGGTMVLGGLVAGPALAIMGFIVGAKASKAKDEAYSNYAQAQRISEELSLAVTLCYAISKRSNMFTSMLSELDSRFKPLICSMRGIIGEYGNDFSLYPQDAKETIAAAASMAGTIKAVIDTPILTSEGNLADESLHLYREVKTDARLNSYAGIEDLFYAEDRAGFIGHITESEEERIRCVVNLSFDEKILYRNLCHYFGTAYFVITDKALVYVHEKGKAVSSSFYIPFNTIESIEAVPFANMYREEKHYGIMMPEKEGDDFGICVKYSEDGCEKGVVFTGKEIGDEITNSQERAECFAKLLNQAIFLEE